MNSEGFYGGIPGLGSLQTIPDLAGTQTDLSIVLDKLCESVEKQADIIASLQHQQVQMATTLERLVTEVGEFKEKLEAAQPEYSTKSRLPRALSVRLSNIKYRCS